jgi:hypothetical protein
MVGRRFSLGNVSLSLLLLALIVSLTEVFDTYVGKLKIILTSSVCLNNIIATEGTISSLLITTKELHLHHLIRSWFLFLASNRYWCCVLQQRVYDRLERGNKTR